MQASEAGVTLNEQAAATEAQAALTPASTSVLQNYPNPFNPTTTIQYQLTAPGRVTLKVYDVLGREVALLQDGPMEAGYHTATFNGARFASGIYFSRLTVQAEDGKSITQTQKMLMLK